MTDKEKEIKWLSTKDNKVYMSTVILAVATALGAWGGFPEPPEWFEKYINTKLAQYSLVFILLWQGGAGKNWKLAAVLTAVVAYFSKR